MWIRELGEDRLHRHLMVPCPTHAWARLLSRHRLHADGTGEIVLAQATASRPRLRVCSLSQAAETPTCRVPRDMYIMYSSLLWHLPSQPGLLCQCRCMRLISGQAVLGPEALQRDEARVCTETGVFSISQHTATYFCTFDVLHSEPSAVVRSCTIP